MKACYYAVEVAPYVLHLYESVRLARYYARGDRTKYIGQILTENIPIIESKGFRVTIPEFQQVD